MIKINALNDAQKPTKKGRKKAVKPSMPKDSQTPAKSRKTQPERISRRWLVTIWPEHLPKHISQQVPIDAPCKIYDIDEFQLSMFLEDNVPHFRSFSGSLEFGEETRHIHLQGYLELSSPVRKTALIKTIGSKHYYEQANGSQQDCLDYVLHTGTHSDKAGLVYALSTIGCLAYAHNSDNHETTLYNVALAMVLEGKDMTEVVRACGIGISKVYFMLSNVSDRLAKMREEEELRVEMYKEKQEAILRMKDEEYRGTLKRINENGIIPNYYQDMSVDNLDGSELMIRDGKLISAIPY